MWGAVIPAMNRRAIVTTSRRDGHPARTLSSRGNTVIIPRIGPAVRKRANADAELADDVLEIGAQIAQLTPDAAARLEPLVRKWAGHYGEWTKETLTRQWGG